VSAREAAHARPSWVARRVRGPRARAESSRRSCNAARSTRGCRPTPRRTTRTRAPRARGARSTEACCAHARARPLSTGYAISR